MSEIKLKLKPFTVPNFVIGERNPTARQDGWIESPSYPLSALDDETLEAMCAEFRDGVFAKARK